MVLQQFVYKPCIVILTSLIIELTCSGLFTLRAYMSVNQIIVYLKESCTVTICL